jgi:hypothetical protein
MPQRMMPAPNIAVPARYVGEVSLAAVRMPKVTSAMRRRTDAPPFRSRHARSPTMVDKIMTVTVRAHLPPCSVWPFGRLHFIGTVGPRKRGYRSRQASTGGNKTLSARISTGAQPITLDGDSNACSEPFRRRDGHRLAHRGPGLNNDHMVRLER